MFFSLLCSIRFLLLVVTCKFEPSGCPLDSESSFRGVTRQLVDCPDIVDSTSLDWSDKTCTSTSDFSVPYMVVDFDKTGFVFAVVATATPKSAVSKP